MDFFEDEILEEKKEENAEAKVLIYLIIVSLAFGMLVLFFDKDYTIKKNSRSNKNYYSEFK